MEQSQGSDVANPADTGTADESGGGGSKEQQMAEMVLSALEGVIPLIAQSMGKDAAAVISQAGQILDQFIKGGAGGQQGPQPAPGGNEMAGANPNAQPMG